MTGITPCLLSNMIARRRLSRCFCATFLRGARLLCVLAILFLFSLLNDGQSFPFCPDTSGHYGKATAWAHGCQLRQNVCLRPGSEIGAKRLFLFTGFGGQRAFGGFSGFLG